jgi:hypothetical protein
MGNTSKNIRVAITFFKNYFVFSALIHRAKDIITALDRARFIHNSLIYTQHSNAPVLQHSG